MTGASAAELPVAQQWFRFSTLDERTTLIEEPHAHELLSANAWHLRGRDRHLLIDCGLGITALTPMLRERFDREPVLVLTHGHLDHMGSVHEFTEVWAHPLEQADDPAVGSLHGPVLAAELRRLRNLPVHVTHAGHGPSFDRDRLHRLIDNYLQA
jgi:glyoxylase-like metal-dependent hydrolase (beta-lactamase superfamily II)